MICTVLFNKVVFYAVGYDFFGYIELLVYFIGVGEVLMMFMIDCLWVIYVTMYIGLFDAIEWIELGFVERMIFCGVQVLCCVGIVELRIVVCGINLYVGEGGLFGCGEEEIKLVFAIVVVCAVGIDAQGLLLVDMIFYCVVRGDFDLVVVMYYDQGYALIKVLGFEYGVNVIVGLLIVRILVDYGIVFDIVGIGVVDFSSMIEVLLAAVVLV